MSRYEATRESLNAHPIPDWYSDAKLGIFIHWGLYSVPAFAPRLAHVSEAFEKHYRMSAAMTPYTEWYWNATRVPESPSAKHQAQRWGGRPYEDFRADFEHGLESWDPGDWARLFRRAGARYVVLVTKHHDGYCLWPSKVPNPMKRDWTSERDVVGELAEAVRGEGLRFGVYYSGGIDWSFETRGVRTLVEFIGSVPRGEYPSYAEAQVRELIERYQPSVLWNDIAWPQRLRPLLQLFADYYHAVPEGVVNDRWMHRGWLLSVLQHRPVQRVVDAWLERRIRRDAARGEYAGGIVPPPPPHYDFRTPEYTSFEAVEDRKWEATRGLTPSFGYNDRDREEDHETSTELVRSFADSVSKNGNLLLNVGPRGVDATIPDPQRARLEDLGAWLKQNGEAIYGTRPCVRAEGETAAGLPVRFTRRGSNLYAIVLGKIPSGGDTLLVPYSQLALPAGASTRAPGATYLADGTPLETTRHDDTLELELPVSGSLTPAYAIRS